MVLFLFSGVLRPLHAEQKAAAHPPLHPAHEAQPHPLFHQLQGDGAQVGEHDTSGNVSSVAPNKQTDIFFPSLVQTFAPGAALWRSSGRRVLLQTLPWWAEKDAERVWTRQNSTVSRKKRSCSWKWRHETSKKKKICPLLSKMKLPVLYLNLILLLFIMNCCFMSHSEQRIGLTFRPKGWSAPTQQPGASTLLGWRAWWTMMHHSTSGRTFTGRGKPLYCQVGLCDLSILNWNWIY